MEDKLITVGDYIKRLQQFPEDWPVKVSTQAGGGISIEHREIDGKPVIAVFGSNGGRFGETPLTEEEYQKQSKDFLDDLKYGKRYTSTHGDHRTYFDHGGNNDTCYGRHYDERVIDRMVKEGLLEYCKQPYSRDGARIKP